MALTSKQEAFCQNIVSGMNMSDAYRAAYDTSKMKPASVNRMAKALFDNLKITSRINELRKPVEQALQFTVEGHIAELERLKQIALDMNRVADAIRAEELKGKALGAYVNRQDITSSDGSASGVTTVIFDFGDDDDDESQPSENIYPS